MISTMSKFTSCCDGVPVGMDDGTAAVGDATRYPDVRIACTPTTGDEYVAPHVVIVSEVISQIRSYRFAKRGPRPHPGQRSCLPVPPSRDRPPTKDSVQTT